jgi:glc operon protein GlcG
MKATWCLAALLVVSAVAAPLRAEVATKRVLTLAGAKQVIAAAVAEAKRLGAPGGAIAVVDDGGNVLALERLDGTFAAGSRISEGKARTAALFKRSTKDFEEIVNKGRTAMVTLDLPVGFTPLMGGVPITVGGEIVGAVGVSGAASAQQDEEIAVAAAAAVEGKGMAAPATRPVTYIDSKKVAEAFAKGMPLLETEEYKVHASRREKPGEAEIHSWETDVIYVLEGTATFVTGGTAVNPRTVSPGEIRGSEIAGGESHQLKKGDVFVVPRGVPHWFREVKAPFLYFVVKPIGKEGEVK